nr:RNA-dependent RNA polymerase [Flumine sobemo-like virus 38]
MSVLTAVVASTATALLTSHTAHQLLWMPLLEHLVFAGTFAVKELSFCANWWWHAHLALWSATKDVVAEQSPVVLALVVGLLCLSLVTYYLALELHRRAQHYAACMRMYVEAAPAAVENVVLGLESQMGALTMRHNRVASANTLAFYNETGRLIATAMTVVFNKRSLIVMPHHVARTLMRGITVGYRIDGSVVTDLWAQIQAMDVFFCSKELDVLALAPTDSVRDRFGSLYGLKFAPLARTHHGQLVMWSLALANHEGYDPRKGALASSSALASNGPGRTSQSSLTAGILSPWHRYHHCNTLEGDSGSPMYNNRSEPVAMHLGNCSQGDVCTANFCVLLYPLMSSIIRRINLSKLPLTLSGEARSVRLVGESAHGNELDYEDEENSFWSSGKADKDKSWRSTRVHVEGETTEMRFTHSKAAINDDDEPNDNNYHNMSNNEYKRWKKTASREERGVDAEAEEYAEKQRQRDEFNARANEQRKREGRKSWAELYEEPDNDEQNVMDNDDRDFGAPGLHEESRVSALVSPVLAESLDQALDPLKLRVFDVEPPPFDDTTTVVVHANRALLTKNCSLDKKGRALLVPSELSGVPGVTGLVEPDRGPKAERRALAAVSAQSVPPLQMMYTAKSVAEFLTWSNADKMEVPRPKWMIKGPVNVNNVDPEFKTGFNVAFRDALASVKPDSSPGVPYAGEYNVDSNEDLFLKPGAIQYIHRIVYNRLLALSVLPELPRENGLTVFRKLSDAEYNTMVNAGYCDLIRMFVKNEPHTEQKARDGRWRIIASVSLADQLIQRILHGALNHAEKTQCKVQPHCIGLGHGDDSIEALAAKFRRGMSRKTEDGFHMAAFTSDVTNFDFSLYPAHFSVDQEYRRLAQKYQPGDWWTRVSANFEQLLLNARFIAGDGTIHVPRFGVQKSGSFCTSSTNSHIRAYVSFIAGAASCIVMGDDAVEFYEVANAIDALDRSYAPRLPTTTLVEETARNGLRLKADSVRQCENGSRVEFMGAEFDFESTPMGYVSTKPGKAVFKALHRLRACANVKERRKYFVSWVASWSEHYRFLATSRFVSGDVRSQLTHVPEFLSSLAEDERKIKTLDPTYVPTTITPITQVEDDSQHVEPPLATQSAPSAPPSLGGGSGHLPGGPSSVAVTLRPESCEVGLSDRPWRSRQNDEQSSDHRGVDARFDPVRDSDREHARTGITPDALRAIATLVASCTAANYPALAAAAAGGARLAQPSAGITLVPERSTARSKSRARSRGRGAQSGASSSSGSAAPQAASGSKTGGSQASGRQGANPEPDKVPYAPGAGVQREPAGAKSAQ